MKKSHAKMKNNKKQITKNDFNKKIIFAYEIHEWLNCALNDLSKSVNIFNASSSQRFEKIENKITRQINKNKKQSDHTNANWKNWICEISARSQDFWIWSFKLLLRNEQTDVKTCDNELFFYVKKNEIWWIMNDVMKNYHHLIIIF